MDRIASLPHGSLLSANPRALQLSSGDTFERLLRLHGERIIRSGFDRNVAFGQHLAQTLAPAVGHDLPVIAAIAAASGPSLLSQLALLFSALSIFEKR